MGCKPLTGVVLALVAFAHLPARAETLDPAGTVTAVSGSVTVSRLSAPPQPLKFRDPLFWRDVVEARKASIARALLAGKTTVTVRELSRLELREEVLPQGIRYTADLVAGKVRASVARVLMRPGEQMQVRTRNAIASVRGTDFIVETLERANQGRLFGLLGGGGADRLFGDDGARSSETVVVTLSGLVEVSNRLGGSGQGVRVGPFEAVRVSGRLDPTRVPVAERDLGAYLSGLVPPRPQETRSADRAEAVGTKVEGVALAVAADGGRFFEQGGGDARLQDRGEGDDGAAGKKGASGQGTQAPSATERKPAGAVRSATPTASSDASVAAVPPEPALSPAPGASGQPGAAAPAGGAAASGAPGLSGTTPGQSGATPPGLSGGTPAASTPAALAPASTPVPHSGPPASTPAAQPVTGPPPSTPRATAPQVSAPAAQAVTAPPVSAPPALAPLGAVPGKGKK
jgi:hypothetical protein